MKASGNQKIQEGQPANVDCSKNIKVKDLPSGTNLPPGHTHLFGNPHYMLDPLNHILVARTIRDALKAARPEVFLANTWADREIVDSVARGANAEVVNFPEWVRGVPDTPDVFAVFDYRVNAVVAALEKVKAPSVADAK